MAKYVENGTFDCGLTGKDWIMEWDADVVVVDDLMYSGIALPDGFFAPKGMLL